MNKLAARTAIAIQTRRSHLRHQGRRAAGMVEYAILGLIAVILGGLILEGLTGVVSNLIDDIGTSF